MVDIRKGDEEGIFFAKSSKGTSEYKVDLNKNTCECPHWKYRCGFSGTDCKHLKDVKKEYQIVSSEDPKVKECEAFVEKNKIVDAIELEDNYGVKVVAELVKEGTIYEVQGKFHYLE